jgi:hypothetical protein
MEQERTNRNQGLLFGTSWPPHNAALWDLQRRAREGGGVGNGKMALFGAFFHLGISTQHVCIGDSHNAELSPTPDVRAWDNRRASDADALARADPVARPSAHVSPHRTGQCLVADKRTARTREGTIHRAPEYQRHPEPCLESNERACVRQFERTERTARIKSWGGERPNSGGPSKGVGGTCG